MNLHTGWIYFIIVGAHILCVCLKLQIVDICKTSCLKVVRTKVQALRACDDIKKHNLILKWSKFDKVTHWFRYESSQGREEGIVWGGESPRATGLVGGGEDDEENKDAEAGRPFESHLLRGGDWGSNEDGANGTGRANSKHMRWWYAMKLRENGKRMSWGRQRRQGRWCVQGCRVILQEGNIVLGGQWSMTINSGGDALVRERNQACPTGGEGYMAGKPVACVTNYEERSSVWD